jgi:hypothetical protein
VSEPRALEGGGESLEERAERLELQADAIRERLGALLGQIDHRTHGRGPRLLRTLTIVAAVAGGAVAAVLVWRGLRAGLRALVSGRA